MHHSDIICRYLFLLEDVLQIPRGYLATAFVPAAYPSVSGRGASLEHDELRKANKREGAIKKLSSTDHTRLSRMNKQRFTRGTCRVRLGFSCIRPV